jgi:hypothetical protein
MRPMLGASFYFEISGSIKSRIRAKLGGKAERVFADCVLHKEKGRMRI